VYQSTWFEAVLLALGVNMTGSLFFYRSFSWSKITVPLFHLAFVLLILGAGLTRYTGIEGSVSIREGGAVNQVVIDNQHQITLPFEIRLTDFVLERYPGSHSPSSYSSYVEITDRQRNKTFTFHIYMNHILKYRGWRFFQTSYDRDEKGTLLTATHDVLGTPVTYAGYLVAIIAMLASLLVPGSFFRKQLRLLKPVAVVIFFSFLPFVSQSSEPDPQITIPQYQAKEFGKLVVQDPKGKMKLLNTLNREFMRKMTGKEVLGRLTADQVVLSMLVFPDEWAHIDLVTIKNTELKKQLGFEGQRVAYYRFFDKNGHYRLSPLAERVFMKPVKNQTKTDKALIELDDKLNIFDGFITGNGLRLFPAEKAPNHSWFEGTEASSFASTSDDSLFLSSILPLYLEETRKGCQSGNFDAANHYLKAIRLYQSAMGQAVYPSQTVLEAEALYNQLNLFGRLKLAYSIIGLFLLILLFALVSRGKQLDRIIQFFFIPLSIVLFLLHTFGIGLRWHIGGFVPLSNAYETMLFVSWVSILTGIILSKRQPIILGLSLILSFAFLLVAGLNHNNPAIGNLVPVLKSPWLSIHVAIITSSYALLALVMLLALVNMSRIIGSGTKHFDRVLPQIRQTVALMQVLLVIGLYLLTAGTIFGAVWANESWGRYWGWDPKETWALITILIYAFVGHMRLIPSINNQDYWFNLASFWAFASILMTFFGVNYFLTGMHSYAGTADAVIPGWLAWGLSGAILFSLLSGFLYFHYKRKIS